MLQVRYFTANGFYVVLDNQFNADDTAKTMTWQWVQWWKQVLQDVIMDSASRNQVMLDLLNEPDSQFWKWENAGPVYLQAMDALHQVGFPDQFSGYLNQACMHQHCGASKASYAGDICPTSSRRTRIPVTAYAGHFCATH